jgi:alkylation response protein AidB-like acyl-CoA dehydrogenase
MRFSLTEDQTAFRDTVRALLADRCPPALLRTLAPAALDELWQRLAGLGVFGAAVPEERGGLGLTEADVVPLLIEVGYAAVPLPVAETALVAAPLLDDSSVTSGRVRVAVARDAAQVPYAGRADRVLLLSEGVWGTPAEVHPVSTVDTTRGAGRVSLADAVPLGSPALASAAVRYDLAVAAQQIGLCRRMLDMTVRYVGDRCQFGAPVGSFQAVKHQLADALLAVEFAEPAVLAAGWALAYRPETADPDVAMAAVLASEAAGQVARTAIQCHGAIGYTVEYDLNLYAKRAWALAAGCDVDTQLARVGAFLGLEEK